MKRYRFRAEARIICETEIEVSAEGYTNACAEAYKALSGMDLRRWIPWQQGMSSHDAKLEPIAITSDLTKTQIR